MRVLVTTASKHGATLGIADAIAEELTETGTERGVAARRGCLGSGQYDAVVLGSAIYSGIG